MAKRRRTTVIAPPRVWLIRAAIGIGVGLLVGFGTGAAAVRIMQPPGFVNDESNSTDANRKPRAAASADQEVAADPVDNVPPPDGTLVPLILGMEEGDARSAITRAGFSVGTVMFKSSAEPMGTVVASFPVPGEAVVLPATVNLILSDGKPRTDSLALPPSGERQPTGFTHR